MAGPMASQPLYTLPLGDFQAAVKALLQAALPSTLQILSEADLEASSLRPLSEVLAQEGASLSICPQCRAKLPRGPTTRLCLACGKHLTKIPAGLDGRWKGSVAEQRFLASLPLDKPYVPPTSTPSGLEKQTSMPTVSSAPGSLEALGAAGSRTGSPFNLDARLQKNLGGSNPESAASTPGRSGLGFSPFSKDSAPSSPLEVAKDGDPFGNLSAIPIEPARDAISQPSEPSAALKPILKDMQDLSFMLDEKLRLPPKPEGPSSTAALATASQAATRTPKLTGSASGEWGDFTS